MSDPEKIATFPGIKLVDAPVGAQPSSEVVEFVEELLAEAKRGRIQAIGVAYVGPDNVTSDGYASGRDSGHNLFAAIADLFYSAAKKRWERGTARKSDDPVST